MPEQKATMQELEVQVKSSLEKAKYCKVTDQTTYDQVALLKVGLASFRKRIKMIYDPMVSTAKEAYDKIRGERDKHLKPTIEGEDILKRKIKDYENQKAFEAEQERKKKAAEAEKERQRLQKIADEEAEAEAKEFGVPVEDVKQEEVETEYIPPVHNIDRASGTGIRRTWKAKVVDISKIPIEYLTVNMPMLNAKARADQKEFMIPGVEAIYD